MHCGVICHVAGVYKGEAELTDARGVLIDYRPVHTLHKIRGEVADAEIDWVNIPATGNQQD